MDTILIVMVCSLLSVTTALTFMELHRIRKHLEGKGKTQSTSTAAK
jgi:hypothetical protein